MAGQVLASALGATQVACAPMAASPEVQQSIRRWQICSLPCQAGTGQSQQKANGIRCAFEATCSEDSPVNLYGIERPPTSSGSFIALCSTCYGQTELTG